MVVQAYGQRAAAGPGLALRPRHEARPQDHGASRQGRLLGHRDQASPGRGIWRAFRSSPASRQPMRHIICCAGKLLAMTDRIYPQFATHNAHTVSAILELATDPGAFEFQRLHGMGEVLHRLIQEGGGHALPHLCPGRGASRSSRLSRPALARERRKLLLRQPDRRRGRAARFDRRGPVRGPCPPPGSRGPVRQPRDLFRPRARNSKGWDLHDGRDLADSMRHRQRFEQRMDGGAI